MTNQPSEPAESASPVPHPAGDHLGTDHPSTDQLADLHEELLPAAEAAALHDHLAGCAECADTFAAFDELTELLAGDPVPPMPATVADRLDAALRAALAEPPATGSTAPTPQPASQSTPRPTAPTGTPAPARHLAGTGPAAAPGPAAGPPGRADRGTGPGRT
ncbi:hypothetical protein ACQRUO_15720, partial [Kitasatospora sp. LaBMicrA B282]